MFQDIYLFLNYVLMLMVYYRRVIYFSRSADPLRGIRGLNNEQRLFLSLWLY